MIFHDYTLSATGRLFSYRMQRSEDLVAEAVGLFADMLKTEADFRMPVPSPGQARIELHWSAHGPVALATFYADGALITTSLLLSDGNSTEVRAAFQTIIDRFCLAARLESCKAWQAVEDRPVIFSVPFPTYDQESMQLVADMETCLAAAFFERLAGVESGSR